MRSPEDQKRYSRCGDQRELSHGQRSREERCPDHRGKQVPLGGRQLCLRSPGAHGTVGLAQHDASHVQIPMFLTGLSIMGLFVDYLNSL